MQDGHKMQSDGSGMRYDYVVHIEHEELCVGMDACMRQRHVCCRASLLACRQSTMATSTHASNLSIVGVCLLVLQGCV